MEKISPPLRIALVAVVVLAAVWFVALRPKAPAEEAPLPAAPGVTGLTNSVQKARDAKEAADASAKGSERAAVAAGTGASAATASSKPATQSAAPPAPATKPASRPASATKPSTTIAATPKPASAKAKTAPANLAAPLVAALRQGKTVVLLFRNKSSDSQAVADAVRAVPRQEKRVVVRVASIGQVGRYATFTQQTPVSQAPTVLVIGPSRKAKVIVGYTSTAEIAEAVRDMRAATRKG